MTNVTRGGTRLTHEQFIALYTFHCIFGVDFEPWADEANEIDWKLIENAEFMRDMFDTIQSLPDPCYEIFVKRLSGKRYKEIGKELKMRPVAIEEHMHKAWRLLRHPKRSKPISHYRMEFNELEKRLNEDMQ
jgi:DNA-directed RNA polymerase specialized sigma24 family protein